MRFRYSLEFIVVVVSYFMNSFLNLFLSLAAFPSKSSCNDSTWLWTHDLQLWLISWIYAVSHLYLLDSYCWKFVSHNEYIQIWLSILNIFFFCPLKTISFHGWCILSQCYISLTVVVNHKLPLIEFFGFISLEKCWSSQLYLALVSVLLWSTIGTMFFDQRLACLALCFQVGSIMK